MKNYYHNFRALIFFIVFICNYFVSQAQQAPKPLIIDQFSQPAASNGKPLQNTSGGYGWEGSWAGNAPSVVFNDKGIPTGAGVTGKSSVLLSSSAVGQLLKRKFKNQYLDNTTLWLSFSLIKAEGNGKLGLVLINNNIEQFYLGTDESSDGVVAGKTLLKSVNLQTGRRLFIRIDFKPKEDIAYVFADPGEESDPDVEGANATIRGNFRGDEIGLTVGSHANSKPFSGRIGALRIGKRFQDVVMGTDAPKQSYQAIAGNYKVSGWQKDKESVRIMTGSGILKITPYLNNAVKVQFGAASAISAAKDFAVSIAPGKVPFSVNEDKNDIVIRTAGYLLKVAKANGRLRLLNTQGQTVFMESERVIRNVVKNTGKNVPASLFELSKDEALYGLGQYRDGVLNLRGKQRELVQVNTQVALPIIYSTRGWGLFWNNPSRTIFQDNEEGMQFTSDYGTVTDYYLFTGNSLDSLVGAYRALTGTAPMPPRWALGYHQSRNKYATRDELLTVAKKMRNENIPMSSIFIDYYYWGKYGTGSHRFDEAQFPDMPSMIKTLHSDLNTKVVATVWPAFKPGSPNYEEMAKQGFLLADVKALDGLVYDTFNPKAAALYWKQVAAQLIPTGIDGWFLDGPEPDNVTSFLKATTYLGPAAGVRNLYPLFHSNNFYNGLAKLDPVTRPYILTRSAWASQQKNGAAIWSGDIGSSFDELKKQVTAGLNFVASGIPYWTTDIGGYSGGNPAEPAYQEIFTRWWQYGVFCPIFRAHGRRYPGDTKGPNELWAFGPKVQVICKNFDELRYRLMPYIYTLSGKTTFENYTPMRLLAFDFPKDITARNIKDEFMYGPAFLVCPVTVAGANHREVYLPQSATWTDFWTGKQYTGGQTINADAPIDRIPLFVKCGSIVPLGPVTQYTDEQPNAELELRIYPGTHGKFTIYEDDGTTTAYKQGKHAAIPLVWQEKEHTLHIGARTGRFTGMKTARQFKITVVGQRNGIGIQNPESKSISVNYNGTAQTIKCN